MSKRHFVYYREVLESESETLTELTIIREDRVNYRNNKICYITKEGKNK